MAALNIYSTPYLKFIYKLIISLNLEKPIYPNKLSQETFNASQNSH